MVSLRKPGKFSLHKNTHLFPDLFNNTALPPTFSGALIIVNISAYWLFFFTIFTVCIFFTVQFEEKFHKKDPFDPKVSLKLQFVVDIRTAARLDCSANLRAQAKALQPSSVARVVHERVKSKAPMLQTDAMYTYLHRRLVGSTDQAYSCCF